MGVNPPTQQVESPKRGQMPLTWGGRHVFTTRRGPTLIGVPYAGQFWSRKNERRVLMGVTFIRKPKQPSYEELEALGIIVEYRPYEALKPINRPHFKNGVGVRLIADDGPWRYICKKGDVGTVQAILPSLKGGTDDMYKVAMTPTGKPPVVAYLFFNELEGV